MTVIDDRRMEGPGWETIREAARTTGRLATVLFIADAAAFTYEHPVLVVDLGEPPRPPFRCIETELWAVENNLNIANMEWEQVSDDGRQDGVYRDRLKRPCVRSRRFRNAPRAGTPKRPWPASGGPLVAGLTILVGGSSRVARRFPRRSAA